MINNVATLPRAAATSSADLTIEKNPDAIARVPRSMAMLHSVLPLEVRREGMDEVLVLACVDPERREHRHVDSAGRTIALSRTVDDHGKSIACPDPEIHKQHVALRRASQADRLEWRTYRAAEIRTKLQAFYGPQRVAHPQPSHEFVESMYEDAILAHAHDISIEPLNPYAGPAGRVRFHVLGKGRLYKIVQTLEEYTAIVSVIKSRAQGMDQTKKRTKQDGRDLVRMPHREVALRIASLPTRRTEPETVTIRVLNLNAAPPQLEHLGMRPQIAKKFRRAIHLRGLTLIAGDPGSGKSTSAHAGSAERNDIETKCVALEDPTEIPIYGVLQAEVDDAAGLTAEEIRAAFTRHAVDFGSAGELRDVASADSAMKLAGIRPMTGTIHGDDSIAAFYELIYRLHVDSNVVERRVHTSLGQHLCGRLCRECRRPVQIPDELRQFRPDAAGHVYEAVGCDFCESGYVRRFGVFEVLEVSKTLRRGIAERIAHVQLEELAKAEGFVPMVEDAIDRVLEGETSYSELGNVPGYLDLIRTAERELAKRRSAA